MAQFRSKPFGVTKNGDKVDEYIISNPGGLEISVLNYGCVIKNLFVPTKTGLVDVVVGHDTLADYEADFNSSGSTCCAAVQRSSVRLSAMPSSACAPATSSSKAQHTERMRISIIRHEKQEPHLT